MTLNQQLGEHADWLLADGQWHSWEKTLALLGARVPPGFASRVAEKSRAANARWRDRKSGVTGDVRPRGREVAPDVLVSRGARITAVRALSVARFETRQLLDGTREVRLLRTGGAGETPARQGDAGEPPGV